MDREPHNGDSVEALRCRALWRLRFEWAAWSLSYGALAAGIVLLLVAAYRFQAGQELPGWGGVMWTVAVGVVLAVPVFMAGCPRPGDAARALDVAMDARDRFRTHLELVGRGELRVMERVALAECRRYASGSGRSLPFPCSLPPGWLVVPVVGIALALMRAVVTNGDGGGVDRGMAGEASESLREVGTRLRSAAEDDEDVGMEEMGLEMERLAERLEGGGVDGREEVFRELTEWQQRLRGEGGQRGVARLDVMAMQRLAEALSVREDFREAARNLREQEYARAADALERAMRNLEAEGRLDAALRQLARSGMPLPASLTEDEASRAERSIREEGGGAREADGLGDGGLTSREMERLVELLREMSGQGSGEAQASEGAGRSDGRAMSMRELLDALERAKQAMRAPDGGGAEHALRQGQPGGFSSGEGREGEHGMPGGPGSEDDRLAGGGVGGERVGIRDESEATRVRGVSRAGETSWMEMPAMPGGDATSAAYRDRYFSIVPHEEESVVDERIPMGRRWMVQRYFESIRPEQ